MSSGILVCRTDRLGDVLLSLPALVYLRLAAPNEPLFFLVSAPYHAVLKLFCESYQIELVEKSQLPHLKPRIAILLHYDEKIAKELKKIPVRVGPYSKVSSFFRLTRGLFQKRSHSKKNEAEYCLDLAKVAVKSTQDITIPPLCFPVHTEGETKAKKLLAELKVQNQFFVVHPGMGGSALNLPVEKYEEVLTQLHKTFPEASILISSGNSFLDQSYREALLKKCNFLVPLPIQDLITLAEVFRKAQGVLAPSTGPIHLAHLVGTQTFGFYSPVRTHLAKRWKPFGGIKPAKVFFPEVNCPGKYNCLYRKCALYNCMETTDWASKVLDAFSSARSSSPS